LTIRIPYAACYVQLHTISITSKLMHCNM